MKVPAVQLYNSSFVQSTISDTEFRPAVGKAKQESSQSVKESPLKMKIPDNLITNKERNFFMQLFPESSDQLAKHVLFNRNGRLQQQSVAKGLIVDGKA